MNIGPYMRAHVLLNLLNELKKKINARLADIFISLIHSMI